MEIQARGRSRRQASCEFHQKLYKLTGAGGAAIWITDFLISVSPIAAEYRAALSISYYPMLLAALIGGLMVGFCVSYFLLRFFEKIPTQDPISKSVRLTFIVLIIVTILIGGPSSFLATSDVLRYFLIGTIFNVLRFLALGIGIGYLYKRLYGLTRAQIVGNGLSGYSLFNGDKK